MNNCDIPSDGKKEKSHAGKGVDRGRVAGEAPLRAPACLVRLSTLSLAPPGQLGGAHWLVPGYLLCYFWSSPPPQPMGGS